VMWTPATRGRMAEIEKKTKRYPTDLTDEEWARIEPFLPGAANSGRPVRTTLGRVLSETRQRAGEELIMRTFSFVIFAALTFWPLTASAQLNVLISGGFSGAYEQVLPEFERTTGSGASEGTGPQTIAAQLTRGVPANVVILSREGLTGLIAANRIVAGTDVDLARVNLRREITVEHDVR
jgi:hypothetical protein